MNTTEEDEPEIDFGCMGTTEDEPGEMVLVQPDEVNLFSRPAPIKKKSKFEFSAEQKALFQILRDKNSGHIVVRAYAGGSKTTSIIEGGKYAPEQQILYVAFGNGTAKELGTKLPDSRCKASTSHSLGCGIIYSRRPKVRIDKNVGYIRADAAIAEYFAKPENSWDNEALIYCRENSWKVAKIVEMVKQVSPYADSVDEVFDVACDFDMGTAPLRETKGTDFFPPREVPLISIQVCSVALLVLEKLVYEATNGKGELAIDFQDMIYLPVRCGWLVKRWPIVIGDEVQDLSMTQIELIIGVCSGRVVLVGDENQCIFSWRGADFEGMKRMTEQLKATVLSLSTCYRCPRLVVLEAQKYCPGIMPWSEAKEGEVHHIGLQAMFNLLREGDFVVSRTNAPLMAVCLRLIASGRRAMMAGNDIGKKLLKILDEVEGVGRKRVPFVDSKDMWTRLLAWGVEEKTAIEEMVRRKFTNASEQRIKDEIDTRVSLMKDQLEMFSVMLKQLRTPDKVRSQMAKLFERDDENAAQKNDRSRYVLCSSVHKIKGLEAPNVFLLWDYFDNRDAESARLKYVSVSRAQNRLYYVRGERRED